MIFFISFSKRLDKEAKNIIVEVLVNEKIF